MVIKNRSLDALCEEQPDVLLVCSSILSTEAVVRAIPFGKLRPDTIVADVLSVKQFPRNLLLEVQQQIDHGNSVQTLNFWIVAEFGSNRGWRRGLSLTSCTQEFVVIEIFSQGPAK